jgi:hypothetical protein
MLSEPPSYPALLDWLATRFVEDGWSLKKLHRRIMLSATYQQASSAERAAQSATASASRSALHAQYATDADNRWLGRFTPRRLEAEAIRDAMLAVSGRLDLTVGGPASADLNIACRSLYVQTARWDRSTFAMLFDAANPDASEETRNVSTVAPQALFLLNHDFVHTQAKHLAERLARERPGDETARIQRAFQLLFARPATVDEIQIARQFLASSGKGNVEAAWSDLAQVLLCGNEFIYLD